MKFIISIVFFIFQAALAAQTNLTISGQTFTNTSDTWTGVNIPRSAPTNLVFTNNTITSRNRYGYLLQAGDESPSSTNNNLDNAIITGNRLNWSGTNMEVIPHGLFTGHNRNVLVKYNYLNYVPMGIIRKSGNNMGNTGGGVAYNIVKGGAVAMVVKGMSNVNIYNNTFYTDRTPEQTWRPLLYIYTNTDQGRYSVAHGTKVFNNIFYTKYLTPAITIADEESLTDFECDNNVYWCETGQPTFRIDDQVLSFAEWQALGYDINSVVIDPSFRDLVNFVPARRIDIGRDLGSEWDEGLSVSARWGAGSPATTFQNGKWQAGAVIHGEEGGETGEFEITQAVIDQSSPAIIEMTFSMDLMSTLPDIASFKAYINSLPATVQGVTISGDRLLLTINGPVSYNDKVTVDYVRPQVNPLQNTTGTQLSSFRNHTVINNIHSGRTGINIFPNPVSTYFNISNTGIDQLPEIIRIFDLSGKLLLEKKIDTEFLYKVPVNLKPGVYVLNLIIGEETEHTQKIIVRH